MSYFMGEIIYLDTQWSQKSGSQDCFKAHIGLVYIYMGDRHLLWHSLFGCVFVRTSDRTVKWRCGIWHVVTWLAHQSTRQPYVVLFVAAWLPYKRFGIRRPGDLVTLTVTVKYVVTTVFVTSYVPFIIHRPGCKDTHYRSPCATTYSQDR